MNQIHNITLSPAIITSTINTTSINSIMNNKTTTFSARMSIINMMMTIMIIIIVRIIVIIYIVIIYIIIYIVIFSIILITVQTVHFTVIVMNNEMNSIIIIIIIIISIIIIIISIIIIIIMTLIVVIIVVLFFQDSLFLFEKPGRQRVEMKGGISWYKLWGRSITRAVGRISKLIEIGMIWAGVSRSLAVVILKWKRLQTVCLGRSRRGMHKMGQFLIDIRHVRLPERWIDTLFPKVFGGSMADWPVNWCGKVWHIVRWNSHNEGIQGVVW